MHNFYGDILSRVIDPPSWFDEYAVPRFEPFAPKWLANIYAHEAALLEIGCQACARRFNVAVSRSRSDDGKSLADAIGSQRLYYGDPPNMRCCPSGPTMSADVIRVLEYWRREDFDWARDSTLEVEIPE